jgi:hypothetical protein
MPGGLMQIVAYGAQDIYLTGNPSITFFKSIYRRHTNFAVESIQNNFNTEPGYGKTCSATIERTADLMHKVYLQAELPDITEKGLSDFNISDTGFNLTNRRYTRWIDNIGHYLIKTVEIEIGGKLIDRHYGDWLEIWSQLTIPASKMDGYRQMIGQDPYNIFGQNTGLQADVFKTSLDEPYIDPGNLPGYRRTSENILVGREIYVPLQFWFCRDYGSALPLIALQHSEVKINIEFSQAHELIMTYQGDTDDQWVSLSEEHERLVEHGSLDVSLWIDYIFLDSEERSKFAQVAHEYIIDQLQVHKDIVYSGTDDNPQLNYVDLFFQHPIKELIWVCKAFNNNREWSNYTNTQINRKPPITSITMFNDTDEFQSPESGLDGLPFNSISEPDIDVIYQIANTSSSQQIEKGTTITVSDNDILENMTNTTIYFDNKEIEIKVGDLVVLEESSDSSKLMLMVTEVSADAKPLKFVTLNTVKGFYLLYTSVSYIDSNPGNVSVDTNGIISIDSGSLDNITKFSELIDFASYNTTRPFNYKGPSQNPVKYAKLQINNYDRTTTLDGDYFNRYQCNRHHTNIPRSPGINVYSFSIKPEDMQPSGSLNFSCLERSKLFLWIGSLYEGGSNGNTLSPGKPLETYVYARGINILRIMNGMGGVAYHH